MTPSQTGYAGLPFKDAESLLATIGTDAFYARLFDVAAGLVPCDGGCVMQYFDDRKPVYLFHKPSPTRLIKIDAYMDGPYVLDPFFRLHMSQGVGEGVFWLQDVAGDDFVSSEYFQAFYSKTDSFDELDAHVSDGADQKLSLFLVRARQSGYFNRADMEALAQFLPVAKAALLKHLAWAGSASAAPDSDDAWHGKLMVTFEHFAASVLTPREREIVMFMLNGYSAALTGEHLAISEGTVRNHRKAIHKKLDIASQAELFALFLGCIPFADPRRPADPLVAYESRPGRRPTPALIAG